MFKKRPFLQGFVVGFFLMMAILFSCAPVNGAGNPWTQAIADAEIEYNIPQGLLYNIAYRESSFRLDVVDCRVTGPNGELGLMQLHPRFHDVEACNPSKAIPYAADYLSWLRTRTDSWWDAVAAYNWGIGNITSKSYIPRTVVDYANFVLGVE